MVVWFRSVVSSLCLIAATAVTAFDAQAQEEPAELLRAREAFVEGAALARDMRWGDALGNFELSARLRPHAGTSYNIGICQRALGQYVRARASLLRALAQHEDPAGTALAESMVSDIRTFLVEIDQVLASLDVTLEPVTASITVDGRPLETMPSREGQTVLLAGTLPAGPGKSPRTGRFRLVLDPGTHVFVISRKGYSDIVRRVTVRPGSHDRLPLVLDRLPGSIHIASNEPRAVVTVDEFDVGMAPVTIARPAGTYHVVVRKKGFVTYETHAELSAGERVDLRAVMRREQVGLTGRWWFWTAVGVAVVGTAMGTYYASRPEPERPPVDGGGLGWAVRVP